MSLIAQATSVALTTDGWSSRANQSFVTYTSHCIINWQLHENVLETVHFPSSHTGMELGNGICETAKKWKTIRDHGLNAVTTDNAANMTVAVKQSGLGPHIGCFAHVLNLGCQKAVKVNKVDRLLSRVRRIVTYFHCSPKATGILAEKLLLMDI